MQTDNPGHISINNLKVKVQRWLPGSGHVAISLLIHGDTVGKKIAAVLEGESAVMQVDGSPEVEVRPVLTVHQVVGSGPTAVHRMEATLNFAGSESVESRLDRMQQEIDQLRAEIVELRSPRQRTARPQPTGLRRDLMSGQTMIESDIETDEN